MLRLCAISIAQRKDNEEIDTVIGTYTTRVVKEIELTVSAKKVEKLSSILSVTTLSDAKVPSGWIPCSVGLNINIMKF